MRLFCFVMLLGCATCTAAPVPPSKVFDACLRAQSTPDVQYTDIAPENFEIEDDVTQQRSATTLVHRGITVGIWESKRSETFGLIYKKSYVTSDNIIVVGAERPSRFTPYTAQWGDARHGKKRYLCITFNFPGLGESGSFQNIRGLYILDISSRPKIYYTVGDIRTIKH